MQMFVSSVWSAELYIMAMKLRLSVGGGLP